MYCDPFTGICSYADSCDPTFEICGNSNSKSSSGGKTTTTVTTTTTKKPASSTTTTTTKPTSQPSTNINDDPLY